MGIAYNNQWVLQRVPKCRRSDPGTMEEQQGPKVSGDSGALAIQGRATLKRPEFSPMKVIPAPRSSKLNALLTRQAHRI